MIKFNPTSTNVKYTLYRIKQLHGHAVRYTFVHRKQSNFTLVPGEPLSVKEAEAVGLVAKIFPRERLLEETLTTAHKLASLPKVRYCMVMPTSGPDSW